MHAPARQRDSPKPPKVGGFLTQSILLDRNLLALAARKSAALAGRPALFARRQRGVGGSVMVVLLGWGYGL